MVKDKLLKKILFIVNVDWFFISHRLPIALAAQKNGYSIHIATQITNKYEDLKKYGFIIHKLKIDRSSTSFIGSFKIFQEILEIYRLFKPDIVHLVTIKPVLIGGMASYFVNYKQKIVMSISGLGFIFISKGLKSKIRKFLIFFFYKLVFMHSHLKVIFQNKNDFNDLRAFTNISENKIVLIPGSGVDLKVFKFYEIPSGEPIVLFPSRLLKSKGIYEFVAAAKILKNKARFVIVGKHDVGNRDCIEMIELKKWESDGIVEFWGESNNMPYIFSQSSIVVLPSYREGFPKSLLEAAASGRAIITTDVPGCRECIKNEITGYLVPPFDSFAISKKVNYLLNKPELIKIMGKKARSLAEEKFDVNKVVLTHLDIYDSLIKENV